MKKILRVSALIVLGLSGLLAAAVLVLRLWQPGLEDYRRHLAPPVPTAGMPVLQATWFGVTALLLSDGERAVLVDPFFTRPPGFLNMVLNREIAPDEALIREWLLKLGDLRIDAVLVSHSHFDHGMDAGVVARLTGATLYGSQSTANIGRGAGLPETQIQVVQPGESYAAGSFRLRFIESVHAGATGGTPVGDITAPLQPPARYLDYKLGGAYSILIEHPQGTALHHGSAGFIPGALRGLHADTVFLGVALVDNLEAYLQETVDAVGARRVVPIHWDDFTRPLSEPLRPFPVTVRLDRFFAHMTQQRPSLELMTLELARPARIP